MNTNDEKKYYITIKQDSKEISKIDKYQNKISLFFSFATLILSIITACLSISISYEAKELQILSNMPNFCIESSTLTTGNYPYSEIKVRNMGGIIKNGICIAYDVIEIYSNDSNYNTMYFLLGNNYIDDLSSPFHKYNLTQNAFIFHEDNSGIPTNNFANSFNEFVTNNSIDLECRYVTYLEIEYNDFKNIFRKEYYIMKDDQLYPIDEDEFNTIYNYKDLHILLQGGTFNENYYINKFLTYCQKSNIMDLPK